MTNEEKIRELKDKIELIRVIAIPREIAAFNFYVQLANKSSREGLKTIFVRLAHEENGHKFKLEQILNEVKEELEDLQGHTA